MKTLIPISKTSESKRKHRTLKQHKDFIVGAFENLHHLQQSLHISLQNGAKIKKRLLSDLIGMITISKICAIKVGIKLTT